jgi:hypothetical protein
MIVSMANAQAPNALMPSVDPRARHVGRIAQGAEDMNAPMNSATPAEQDGVIDGACGCSIAPP